jgi:FkbM family methyltransferase
MHRAARSSGQLVGERRLMALLGVLRAIVSHPLNDGKAVQALLRFLRWQVGSCMNSGAMVFDWVNGSKFLVRNGETGLTGNNYTGFQEYAEMAFVLHATRPGDLFVDVGANVGSYTVLACAAAGADGACFEPVPATYARLLENIRLNHLEHRVRSANVGVGSARGVVAFSGDMDTGNRVLADGEARAGRIDVQVDTLDALLQGRQPTLMKIDVEGYETAVIAGAQATLGAASLHAVVMEINGSGAKFGFDEALIFERMAAHGFAPFTYDPPRRRLVALVAGDVFPENILFVRDLDTLRARLASAPACTVNGKQL